jgi:hypothetical protein
MRQVIYKKWQVSKDGVRYSPEQKQGGFVAYTPDYKFAVIETTYGEIVRVEVEDIRFLHPQEE